MRQRGHILSVNKIEKYYKNKDVVTKAVDTVTIASIMIIRQDITKLKDKKT